MPRLAPRFSLLSCVFFAPAAASATNSGEGGGGSGTGFLAYAGAGAVCLLLCLLCVRCNLAGKCARLLLCCRQERSFLHGRQAGDWGDLELNRGDSSAYSPPSRSLPGSGVFSRLTGRAGKGRYSQLGTQEPFFG